MILLGSLVNGAAVVVGGLVGMFAGKLLPERLRGSVMAALSLITIGIAIPGLMKSSSALIPILSMVIGTIIGELLNIDAAVNRLGDALQKKCNGSPITEGFVTGSLVFAVGALAVMGALESGLQQPAQHPDLQGRHRRCGCAGLCLHHGTGRGALRRNGLCRRGLHGASGLAGGPLSG